MSSLLSPSLPFTFRAALHNFFRIPGYLKETGEGDVFSSTSSRNESEVSASCPTLPAPSGLPETQEAPSSLSEDGGFTSYFATTEAANLPLHKPGEVLIRTSKRVLMHVGNFCRFHI
jgi:hypothetical protein